MLLYRAPAEFITTLADRELHALQALEPRSLMVVPLIARERTLGALAFICSAAGRTFSEDDLDLAMELGRWAAAALDNAGAYRKAQDAIAARDEVLGYVAHDIPQIPLSAIAIAISLVARKPPRPRRAAQGDATPDNIGNALKRMNRIVDDLLDVTRLDC